MAFWVYMLQCADRSYDIGHTDDPETRRAEHASGALSGYTSTRRPVRAVCTPECPSCEEALAAERQLLGYAADRMSANSTTTGRASSDGLL